MKSIFLLSAFAGTLMFACNNTTPQEEKVIEVEAPAQKVVVEEDKGTSVKLNSDGGSVSTPGLS
ncbi:MAG: hypothetical protein ACK4ND_13010, partial [Cytophagaceae bacterium]